jgi:hypothetical protein
MYESSYQENTYKNYNNWHEYKNSQEKNYGAASFFFKKGSTNHFTDQATKL